MAIYHCEVKIHTRQRSIFGAIAYRAGEKLTEPETGRTYDYTKKSGVVFSKIVLCAGAPDEWRDRNKLWRVVELKETVSDARLAREFEISLPRELSEAQQLAVADEYARYLASEGMCVDYSVHSPDKKGKNHNPHVHMMCTTRPIDRKTGEWVAKEKKEYAVDDKGERIPIIDPATGKQKIGPRGRRLWKRITVQANPFNDKKNVERWRKKWEQCANEALAQAGVNERIDCRSLKAQGIDREPLKHEGVELYIRERGETPRLKTHERNEEIKARNLERAKKKLIKLQAQQQSEEFFKSKPLVEFSEYQSFENYDDLNAIKSLNEIEDFSQKYKEQVNDDAVAVVRNTRVDSGRAEDEGEHRGVDATSSMCDLSEFNLAEIASRSSIAMRLREIAQQNVVDERETASDDVHGVFESRDAAAERGREEKHVAAETAEMRELTYQEFYEKLPPAETYYDDYKRYLMSFDDDQIFVKSHPLGNPKEDGERHAVERIAPQMYEVREDYEDTFLNELKQLKIKSATLISKVFEKTKSLFKKIFNKNTEENIKKFSSKELETAELIKKKQAGKAYLEALERQEQEKKQKIEEEQQRKREEAARLLKSNEYILVSVWSSNGEQAKNRLKQVSDFTFSETIYTRGLQDVFCIKKDKLRLCEDLIYDEKVSFFKTQNDLKNNRVLAKDDICKFAKLTVRNVNLNFYKNNQSNGFHM